MKVNFYMTKEEVEILDNINTTELFVCCIDVILSNLTIIHDIKPSRLLIKRFSKLTNDSDKYYPILKYNRTDNNFMHYYKFEYFTTMDECENRYLELSNNISLLIKQEIDNFCKKGNNLIESFNNGKCSTIQKCLYYSGK